uniref:Multiple epidermal growth factor-like protein 8 n=2 Tax=Lutzomyia longipalpis TaxID=7200 RepID=A0A1B0CSP3_LUTLO
MMARRVVRGCRRSWPVGVALLLLFAILQNQAQAEPLRVAAPPGTPPPNQPCDRTRRIFTEPYGEISDGPSGFNYTQDSHCEWLIKAKNDSQYITLTFRSMGTECSYDYIFVYDGDSFRSPLLGSFSGKTEPQRVVATSGSMLILLYSDTNYVLDGFKAEFSVTNCPNNCTNRGKCVNHKCICHGDWMGVDCSGNACPDRCGEDEGHGVCSGECKCRDEFSGQSCSLHKSHPVGNEWHWLSNSIEGLSPRAAHTAVYVPETDSLYVFGGYDLNNVLSSLQIYRFEKSRWEDEWGMKLKSSHKFDKTHVKEALETDSSQWGLSASASFLRNTLSTVLTDHQLAIRDKQSTNHPHINRTTDDILEDIIGRSRPTARYGHAACLMPDGFIIYGGKLASGGLSSNLWFYNVSNGGGEWTLRAMNSTVKPPALTRHTLTLAGDYLYLFGGSRDNGEFSSRMFRIKVLGQTEEDGDEQWEEVTPRGGKVLDVRVVAHTTVYHKSSNSLIVYGGVVAGVARFSKLSDRMFAFQLDKRHWTEIMYPRTPLRDAYIPRERAFHTTTIVGNYLIVFGGYSHRHNKEEICYDNQMYLYHLGCHTWVNQDVLGVGKRSRYPKQQGVFAHAASLRNKNTLLIVGGYHGNVNGDLLAYTLPPMLVIKDEETFEPEPLCYKHTSVTECLSDPECGWCSADGVCYGRTVGANCTTNLQTTRCPGICPALGDCHSCLLHGAVDIVEKNHQTVAHKLGLGQCTWCVQNARCHHKDDNYGVCGEDTPSQSPGWWGTKGTEIVAANQCTELDKRPGLTFIKYLHPVNWTMPDQVTIVNATMVDFNAPSSNTHTEQSFHGDMVARLAGFIRPPSSWEKSGEMLRVCASYSDATLRMSTNGDITLAANISTEATQCTMAQWPPLKSSRIMVDLQARRSVGNGNMFHHHHHSKMGLQHNRTNENAKAFTFEYLEPFSNGTNCDVYRNCLHCLSDSACGWCEVTNTCLRRTDNEMDMCRMDDEWMYLTLQPSHCANCSNYISCEQCVESGLCEWWAEDARCSRRGRAPLAVTDVAQCPAPCYARETCSACLDERGRCVWCEATQQCFSFSVYTSEYQFGLCREWLDQTMPLAPSSVQMDGVMTDEQAMAVQQSLPAQQCKSCARFSNCTSCLRSLSCGWCFDRDNPIEGICMQGDFNRSTEDCAAALNTTQQEAEWAYAQCPDVDECGLGLHDCHPEAKCTNTHGSYNCHCRRGFIGDGRTSCVRTCFETCIHGYCEGAPNYKCRCNLGWTGADCSINCGCNNHSTCVEEVGKCDECQNWTEGEFCERCSPGSYGNATSFIGCQPCNCNGHGNEALGVCDVQTGECFCQDNTEGFHCEVCNREFYGDPRDGGQCFFQCEARGMLTHIGRQGIGSMQSHKSLWGGADTRECLWIIRPRTPGGSLLNTSLIQLHINRDDLNVSCVDNAVYVYDGLPDLTGNTQQSQLLAVFCNQDSTAMTVEAHTGHLTVYYKQGPVGQGFNAMYSVHSCSSGTCQPPHVCTDNGKCVCPQGFTGPHCSIERCPGNCSVALNQGTCDTSYGRCLCATGFGGPDCSVKLKLRNVVMAELFNSQLISESLEHLRKTLPRFGHSMVADKRAYLWIFGGYSLSHGPLNDIRQFDTKNNTWMQVTVDSTPEAKMPQGRYFQAAEIVSSKQAIFVYGGLTGQGKGYANSILGDFWQFSLQNQRWDEVEMEDVKPPPLAGHTLTFVKDGDRECLVIIGGFSTERGMQNELWEYDVNTGKWEKLAATGAGPVGVYGHTTVFHANNMVLYVYGGVEFEGQRTVISNKLYALQYNKMMWSELPVFSELIRGVNHMPRGRFLHSAITTDGYMIVFGGQTNPYNSTDVMAAYVFKCNYWVRLTEEVEIVGNLPSPTYAQAMSYEQESGSIYVIGGWDGNTRSRVTRITVPSDLCELWSSGKYMCRNFMGCSFCSVDNTSHCFSSGRSEVCTGQNARTIFNYGALCDDTWLSKRKCSTFHTCTTCLASWPSHAELSPACQWCESCGGEGRCIPAGQECDKDDDCGSPQTTIGLVNQCPSLKCAATDCESCHALSACSWAQNGTDPWQCVATELVEEEKWTPIAGACPPRCNIHRNCSTCLAAHTSEGGWEHCLWSTQLNECISPSYQPLYCAGGVCGLVLTHEDPLNCPEPCSSFTQCSTCLRHAHCGWCSREGSEGDGVCTEGSIESPTEYPAASTCDIIYASRHNITNVDPEDEFKWYYVQCPPENECINGHHTCNPKSEQCVDLMIGYECICGVGFREDQGECTPVCTQGCVRGNCIEPNLCECHFGYVGANCSIQCQCNGHSNCGGPDRLDECLECHNNTMGAQCEKCQRFFVGDPRNNGECVPCIDYCNGHSDLCVMKSSDAHVFNLTRNELEKYLTEGPTLDAVCLRCDNRTDGDRCEGCITGHFRGTENHRDACRPCECHGHGNTCDPVTGDKCNCGNNTESDATCSATASKNSAQQCWSVQCSKCKETYSGNPIEGHQCYKHINVESKMCFDAKIIDECKIKPSPLKPGQTVFFVIQPRFMNVDIRIIVDVTQGELDLYMSPQEDSFVVTTNQTTGYHHISLDHHYRWVTEIDSEIITPLDISPATRYDFDNMTITSEEKIFWTPHIHDCKSLSGSGFYVKDKHARDLSTYITLNQCNTLLRVFGLKNRLVLTLPQNAHNLSATRFFMALKASAGPAASYGLVFFRQDQLHIDLFVFFSVFFSCFFLFLAVCVVAWKAKQAADVRRARRRHVVEMLHMAKRPFACVTVHVDPDTESPVQNRRTRGRVKQMIAQGQQQDVRPVAIEPTADGVAAVGTVFIRLPGKYRSPVGLALASALITLPRMYPTGSRAFLRRRGSGHGVQQPQAQQPPNLQPPRNN